MFGVVRRLLLTTVVLGATLVVGMTSVLAVGQTFSLSAADAPLGTTVRLALYQVGRTDAVTFTDIRTGAAASCAFGTDTYLATTVDGGSGMRILRPVHSGHSDVSCVDPSVPRVPTTFDGLPTFSLASIGQSTLNGTASFQYSRLEYPDCTVALAGSPTAKYNATYSDFRYFSANTGALYVRETVPYRQSCHSFRQSDDIAVNVTFKMKARSAEQNPVRISAP